MDRIFDSAIFRGPGPAKPQTAIQPHGVLLALDAQDLRIVHVSGDMMGLLASTPQSLLGEKAACVFTRKQLRWLGALADGCCSRRVAYPSSFANRAAGSGTSDLIAHCSGGLLVIELDPRREQTRDHPLAIVQTMLRTIQRSNTPLTFCQAVVDEVRRVTCFDRVSFCRLAGDHGGSVIAEALGVHRNAFPASHDLETYILTRARGLFPSSRIHAIPDTGRSSAPILSLPDSGPAHSLDLSQSAIGSVDPRYRQRLADLGVVASLSISVVIRGQLWGVIACHHREPRYLPYALREAFELFAELMSSQLEARLAGSSFEMPERQALVPESLPEVGTSTGGADLPMGVELSSREIEVAQLAAAGFPSKHIALKLHIGVKSVETYKARYMNKLGFHSKMELIHYAIGKGWLGGP